MYKFIKSPIILSILAVVFFLLGAYAWVVIETNIQQSQNSFHFWYCIGIASVILSFVSTFFLFRKTEIESVKPTEDSYNLFLDDERVPLDCAKYMSSFKVDCKIYHQPWEIVRSYKQFKEIIERRGLPDLISFDHDLADNWKLRESLDVKEWFDESENREYTGMDCAKWLTQYCEEKDLLLPEFVVHSMNSVGRENIKSYLTNFKLRQDLTINGITWKWQKDLATTYFWDANWSSLDGDTVRLYVEKDETGFTLECFSGIPGSSIYIDSIDYGALWHKAGFIESIAEYSYIQQSVILANYLCEQFCEKVNF